MSVGDGAQALHHGLDGEAVNAASAILVRAARQGLEFDPAAGKPVRCRGSERGMAPERRHRNRLDAVAEGA